MAEHRGGTSFHCPPIRGVDFSFSTNRDLDFYRAHFQGYILRYFAILWTKPHIVDDALLSSKVGYIS